MMNDYNIEKTPFIEVEWEDTPENITEERIRRIKKYFQKKYETYNVTVKPRLIVNRNNTKLASLDSSENIFDKEYQKKLYKEYIKENTIDIDIDMFVRLDERVNSELNIAEEIKYTKWFIKKLEFSNILSFGDDNVIDFKDLNGITVVESDPPNYGGKTTATVDLLLFLFFGNTTKTKTNGEIFNLFRNKDEVFVRGHLVIDNEKYVITRTLSRKKKRNSDDYNVKSSLDFFKDLGEGNFENLNDEQRRETEKVLKKAIGSQEDFLSTILTTGYNLEELIESKPTARGEILMKLLGLDILKEKEQRCKDIYNDWKMKASSTSYNITDLISSNEEYKTEIKKCEDTIKEAEKQLDEDEKKLKEYENKKDTLLSSKNKDVDKELIKVNPTLLKREIDELKEKKNKLLKKDIDVKEPSEYYLEDDHNELKDKISKLNNKISYLENESEGFQVQIKELEEGSICPTCKRPLEDVDHTEHINGIKDKISNNDKNIESYNNQIKKLEKQELKFKKLKEELDLYENNKLLKSRNELEIERKSIDIESKQLKLDRYDSNKKKMEENQKIDGELIMVKTRIETYSAKVRNGSVDIQKNKSLIDSYNEKISNNERIIKQIKKEEKFIPVFKTYLDIFGKNGISKVIVKNIIPLINEELSRTLIDTVPFTVELNINNRNELEFLAIDNETRIVKSLSACSGYEKTASSIAIRCILAMVSSLPKPNIIVMDEIFGKVADENLESLGTFFAKIKKYFEHILVISHNPLIRNWSDTMLLIKKVDNVSVISEVNKIKDILRK